ncbi:LOG family protein [Bythopirellula polymerisocia]|uniref:AMP nucleosidase n=1 Tax=Bythopirellula polymerisocia TaxID=2528003 RepID=A0A5C6CZW3_9BACT|nr:LOG family protein [Bythopirellula polymerisocia]TWU28209.1 putative lysine decarboxylase [Bythopirellula polymerisocia]
MDLPPEVEENRQAILRSPSYRMAEVDIDFLGRAAQRPIRMQLELHKVETLLRENKIDSTIVVFGGTRVVERDIAEQRLDTAKKLFAKNPSDDSAKRGVVRAESVLSKARFYDDAREFSRIVSSSCQHDGICNFVIATGGGPGVMEAANRGAFEIGAKSIGFNIELPHEQEPNPYITPELCFQFSYFALRKFHFVLRAAALVVFPGGFGTLDELFNTLTLRQTGRMQEIPIILYGKEYWKNVINFQYLSDHGVVADDDLELCYYADTPAEAWKIIADFHHVG